MIIGRNLSLLKRPLRNNNDKTHFTRTWSRVGPDVVLGHSSGCWQVPFLPLSLFLVLWIRNRTKVTLSPEKVGMHFFGTKKETVVKSYQVGNVTGQLPGG